MLNPIVKWSVQNRGAIVVLSLLTLAYGLWVSGHSKLDVFPE